MRRWALGWAALAVAGAPLAAGAGSVYRVACADPECGFEASVSFGGGMQMAQITGHCLGCGKFVYVEYRRDGAAPEPLATIWDSVTGRRLKLYACPHCQAPFAEIPSEKALIHCPACSGDKLSKELELLFD